jgi:hypothetical protein
MNDIKRYNCVANDHDAIQPDNDGEFVKFEDYEAKKERMDNHVLYLEKTLKSTECTLVASSNRSEQLEAHCRKIFKIVSCFNGGRTPVGFDGMIMLKVDEYNALVNAINEGIK